MKLKIAAALFLSLSFSQNAFSDAGRQPTVHQLVENFLENYSFGDDKETIIERIKDEPVSTLINDTATFYRFILIDDILSAGEGNDYSVVPIKISLEFEADALVWKQMEWIGEFKGSEAVHKFNNVISGVSTEIFGGPVLIAEEEKEARGAGIIRTSWSREDISSDLFMCDSEDALFYRVYDRKLLKSMTDGKSVAIDQLRFGIVKSRSEERISYLKETRRIPLGSSLFHGLDFKILPKQANVRLEIVRPGDEGNLSAGSILPAESPEILNYSNMRDNFSAVFNSTEADRLGKYQIKIYIDRILSGMVAYEVVANN